MKEKDRLLISSIFYNDVFISKVDIDSDLEKLVCFGCLCIVDIIYISIIILSICFIFTLRYYKSLIVRYTKIYFIHSSRKIHYGDRTREGIIKLARALSKKRQDASFYILVADVTIYKCIIKKLIRRSY